MSPFSSSSPLQNDALTRELDAGERMMWSGQPDPARMKQKAIPQALLAIPLTAFMAFWIWTASGTARSALAAGKTPDLPMIIFPAFGFLGAGLIFMMALGPWLEERKAKSTFYAMTDRRALVVVEGRKRQIKSVLPSQFQIERIELSSGRGDVILRRETTGGGRNTITEVTGFYGIENAREVERLARELASSSR